MSQFTVWQSIEILTNAVLNLQKGTKLLENAISQHKLSIEKGNSLQNGMYEASLVIKNLVAGNDHTISIPAFSKIGYSISNDDELIIHNHITKEEVKIPKEFHYLKVIGFDNNIYKLSFCNLYGNEFFTYKKYDAKYSDLSDEYKFINLHSVRQLENLKLSDYCSYEPSFVINKGYTDSNLYSAELFRLTERKKLVH
ncbi:hypothetical protein [Wolbachia endosymbiont of Pentidionis agamae]|uniref:hypothetical protein n=1 Tax=Wolbachia endosymbiont of Pentidionis agamae TaxID=3110435 RepID=UPI002FD682A1